MYHIAHLNKPRTSPSSILQRLMAQGFSPTLNYFCSIAAFSFLSAQ